MKIVESNFTEIETLLSIFNQAKASATGFSNHSTDLQGFLKEIEGEKIYVAKIRSSIVGFLSIWAQGNFIHHLYVSPDFQSKGVGKALLKECEKNYGLPLSLKCIQANTRACTFYERNGWVAVSTGEGRDGRYILYRIESR